MSFIDHKAKVSKEEIEALIKDLENPVIALLNKRHSEVNPLQDAGEIIRIHNATIKAIEDLNVRVSRIESQLGLNTIQK